MSDPKQEYKDNACGKMCPLLSMGKAEPVVCKGKDMNCQFYVELGYLAKRKDEEQMIEVTEGRCSMSWTPILQNDMGSNAAQQLMLFKAMVQQPMISQARKGPGGNIVL